MNAALALLLVAAQPPAAPDARAEIAGQIAAWNRGDLEAALRTYCPSEDITWVNSAGLSRGYESFARSMRTGFGGGSAGMGTLSIAVEAARDLGPAGSLVTVRWQIMRGGARLMGGVSTQLWAQCDGRLRVVFEHAS